jgi:hypothetical protein
MFLLSYPYYIVGVVGRHIAVPRRDLRLCHTRTKTVRHNNYYYYYYY